MSNHVGTEIPPVRNRTLAIVGGGPRAIGVLERLAANLDELWNPQAPLLVHIIDPFPVGGGRIWRFDQSPLLKLNSMAADVTMYTDESSTIAGPVRPGPSLIDWVELVRSGDVFPGPVDAALADEIAVLSGASFPTRRLQSLYLGWFYDRAVLALGSIATVEEHRATAIRVDDTAGGSQLVVLSTGAELHVDTVLFSLGHNGAAPGSEHAALADFARDRGLVYIPPAFTADADTSVIRAGQRVIVRGFGLAAVDLTVLLTEGRGGRFSRENDRLIYTPSGREPRLSIGSRRGVPYHSKISSALQGEAPAARFFTPAVAAELERSQPSLDFATDIWPLIAQEMLWSYYRELFTGHPDRVRIGWAEFADRFAGLDPHALVATTSVAGAIIHQATPSSPTASRRERDGELFRALVHDSVIDPIDRLFLPDFDRPLDGARFESSDSLQEAVRDCIRQDLLVRTDPRHSATLGLFLGLLTSLFTLSDIVASPRWSARSRVEDIHGWWISYFSYIASGPPGHRLEEILALSDAGIVEFLGGEIWVEADAGTGQFRAGSANVERVVTAGALVDARLPESPITRSDNTLLRALIYSGGGVEEVARDADFVGVTGHLAVRQTDCRVLSASGDYHERRYAIGPYTNSPFVGAFSRPRTNAVSFRENDKVARAILVQLAGLATEDASPVRTLDDAWATSA